MPDDLPLLGNSQPPADEQSDTEQRMRRALGLHSEAAATKTVGGPVKAPVAGLRRPVTSEAANRMVETQAALAAERLAREQAEAALGHAEEALRHAETRRIHAEQARDEAVAALASERTAREAAEQTLRQASVSAQPVAPADAPRRRGRRPRRRGRRRWQRPMTLQWSGGSRAGRRDCTVPAEAELDPGWRSIA